jgi:hypothetical protein
MGRDALSPKQEPKYEAVGEFYEEHDSRLGGLRGKHHRVVGQLVNRATGEAIPDDEPVFVFRARDKHAAMALAAYHNLCADQAHRDIVQKRIEDFVRFANAHPDRMKEPDSPA